MLIAVRDQGRERVHVVRVLYHWNLIRLTEKQQRGGGGEEEQVMALIFRLGVRDCRRPPHNYDLAADAPDRRAIKFRGAVEEPNRRATVKIVWFVIKNTSAVSPWNSVTQSKRLWGGRGGEVGGGERCQFTFGADA